MQFEITFWQAFAAIISLFILWSATLTGVLGWLNRQFNSLLKKDDYDIRHLVLQQRIEAVYDIMNVKIENNLKKIEENWKAQERRMRSMELWAASRGVNGPESYKFTREREE